MTSGKQDYLLVAAIDFGTTYSGFAYSTRNDFQRDPTKAYLKQWPDPTSPMMLNKTSTCILFNKEKQFSKFGFEAEAKYLDLILEEEQKDWFFFRRFKMSLYNIQVNKLLYHLKLIIRNIFKKYISQMLSQYHHIHNERFRHS